MSVKDVFFGARRGFADVPLRFGLAVLMIGHGGDKLLGWFGTETGPAYAELMTEKFGENWAFWMQLAGAAELLGGLLVLLGFFTRWGALAITGVMAVALFYFEGFWPIYDELTVTLQNPGGHTRELPFICLMAALALLFRGGGSLSLDAVLGGLPKK